MSGHSTKSLHKRSFTVVVILLLILATSYCFHNDTPSKAESFPVINTYDHEPTTAEKIDDWTIIIENSESARVSIKQYSCEAKRKCKPVNYARALLALRNADSSLALVMYEQVDKCRKLYGRGVNDCVEYYRDLHSAIHIVDDLIRTITREDHGGGNISVKENRIMLKYLDILTVHQQLMKIALKCLKNTSGENSNRCDSLRPPEY